MILSYKSGPGSLTLGSGPLDVSAQVQECAVEWEESVTTQEAIDVLSGEQLPEEEEASYKAKLVATFLQDTLAAAGLVDYTWDNAGATVAFEFIPNDTLTQKVTGTLRVIPLKVGGAAKQRATSDWSVRCLTAALAANA